MAISAVVGLVTAVGASIAVPLVFGAAYSITALGFATAFAVGAGVSAISKALVPKPDLGAQMRGTTVTARDPAGPRKIIYGEMRVGGNVVFMHHSGTDNAYLHLVVAFATHEIESYEEIWFNDNKIWDGGSFQGDWGTYVTVDVTKKGTATQTASDDLVDDVTVWTDNHKLSGIAYIAFKLEWNQDKFPQGVPNITALIKGRKVYDPRTSTTAFSKNPALCVRDYLLDTKYGLGEDAANIDNDAVIAAANICDTTGDYSDANQKRYECNGLLLTTNQLKSNIEQLLSSMGGRLTYSGGKFYIQAAGYTAPTFSFDESSVISEIKTQTKQSRRTIYNGVKGTFVSEEKNYKVMDYPAQILKTTAGSFVTGTKYKILFVGTTDFTAIGAAANDVGVEFTATGAGSGTGTASKTIVEDGAEIYLDMPLPFVTNNKQAQRIAKIAMLKSRQQVNLAMTVNMSALKIKVGDTVNITNARLGYSDKIFEVIDYDFVMKPGGECGVNLNLIETASSIYDWTTADEEDFLSGGELDLYDGRTVNNVGNLQKNEFALVGPDGTSTTTVELTWEAPTDAFVDFYKVRWNVNGTTNYFHAETKETRILLTGLDVSSTYDFRVQVQNLLGVTSSGTTLTGEVFEGDQTAPSSPTNTNATGGIQTITAEWENNSDDIDYAYTLVFVETSNTQPANYSNPTAKVAGEEYVLTGLSGAVTRWFFLANVDFTGNVSGFTSGFSGTSVIADVDDVDTGSLDDALGSEFPVNGLAHYWPCNSVQGDILVDVVGGVNATQVTAGGATISTDSPTGKSFTNGASNGFTLLSDSQADAIQTSDGFAWSIWFKSESTTGPAAGRIISRDFSDNWGVRIYQDESPNQTIRFFGEPDEEDVTPTVAQGEWHHVCIVEDGNGEMFGYLNGEKVTSALEYTPTTAARPVAIGCAVEATATGGNAFKGKLTEVRAYNRALTDVEVRALYRVPSASMPQELDGELIVDGTIIADKIKANTISFNKLLGGVNENATSTLASSVNIAPNDYTLTIDSITLDAPADTTVGHKPLVIVKMEWFIRGSSNWDDDGGDLPEVEFIVNDEASGSLGTIANFVYTHPFFNDTSANYEKFTAEMIGFFDTAITTSKTFYIKGSVTNFDGLVSQDRITIDKCDAIVIGIR